MKLADWLKSRNESPYRFAARVGISRVAVYRYLAEGRVPTAAIIARIETETRGNVGFHDWLAPKPEAE